jgi:phospholipid/cholesterol/gamma-HCH transport system substrate-binding protein
MTDPAGAEPSKLVWQRRQIVALLVLAALLALALAGGIAYQHGAFSRMAQVYFLADDATGLSPGTPVRMSGFRIGKISAMHLQPDLSVKVVLAIEAEPYSHLKADARADVVREQLRPAAIDLRPGSAQQLLPEADPRVGFRKRGTLTEIAEDLRTRLVPILEDVKQLTGTARARRGDIDAMLENASALSRDMAGTAKEMQALAQELRSRVARLGTQGEGVLGEANRSVVRLGNLIGQADKSLGSLNDQLPGMLNKTNDLLVHLDAVLRDARTISSASAKGMPEIMRGAAPLIDDSRDTMQGLRESWPLRSMLPPPPPAALPIDSHDPAALRIATPR